MFDDILNFDDADTKRRFAARVGSMRGRWHVEMKLHRPKRSQAAAGYYFGVVCKRFAEYLGEQGDEASKDYAHQTLRKRFAPRITISDPRTGEMIEEVAKSTAQMNGPEFHEYVEKCRAWLLDFFNVFTEDPDPEYFLKHKTLATAGEKW